jgi:hypothetical protein
MARQKKKTEKASENVVVWDFSVCRDPALIPRQIGEMAVPKKPFCE